jgi:phytoene dehydrogenase-like protein
MRLFPTDFVRWKELRGEGRRGSEEYRARKAAIAEALVQKMETFVPGITRSTVVRDVCTPPTFERYTSATGGGWYDGVGSMGGPAAKTPIANLYLTGTKAQGGGGLPTAVGGGMLTARTLLRMAS